MFFVGTYDLTVDGKNRCSIPHPVRSKINCDSDGRAFYVLPGQRPGTLAIYPERYFEAQRRRALRPEDLTPELHEWMQFELALCYLLDPDNQGRILLPERLLKRVGIGKEVTLTGVGDHLVLWNRAEFAQFEERRWPDYPEHRQKAMCELRAVEERTQARPKPERAKGAEPHGAQ